MAQGAKINDGTLNVVAETIDRLISLDFRDRGITGRLYAAARDRVGAPLAYAAALAIARALDPPEPEAPTAPSIRNGAIICTGFMIRSAGQAETDGLTGAALLARGLATAFGIVPVLATEDMAVGPLGAACTAAGLRVTTAAGTSLAPSPQPLLGEAVIVPFPAGSAPAAIRPLAADLLSSVNPRIVISIERPGANMMGVHHSARGQSISDITAPLDELFTQARAAGVPTVAIGDLGNELGMGVVADTLRALSPLGSQCSCPCGSGIACDTPADVTVVGAISDDAAYGTLACLAALRGDISILPTPDMLQAVLRAAVAAGAVDGLTGKSEYSIDIVGEAIHCALIGLMGAVLACAGSGE
ncbi:MAG: glutamate cyclase domain-containing protein [Bacillota bacterium]